MVKNYASFGINTNCLKLDLCIKKLILQLFGPIGLVNGLFLDFKHQ